MRSFRAIVVLLVLTATSTFFTGCVVASHTANGNHHTRVLGGLVEVKEGAYEKQPAGTFPLNDDTPYPGSNLTGNKTSVLWGLISFRNQ